MTTLVPSFLDGSSSFLCEKSMNSVVTTLASLFLIGSSSFLQATRTPIKSWMGSNWGVSDEGFMS